MKEACYTKNQCSFTEIGNFSQSFNSGTRFPENKFVPEYSQQQPDNVCEQNIIKFLENGIIKKNMLIMIVCIMSDENFLARNAIK